MRGTLRGRSLHGGRSSELSRTLFGTLFPWLGRSVFAKIAKKALFPAKTAVFAGKNGFFADFREKSSAKHAFFLKKIGCVRENIISALPRSLFAWGRSAVALSVCRSLRVSLRGTLFKQVKVLRLYFNGVFTFKKLIHILLSCWQIYNYYDAHNKIRPVPLHALFLSGQ